MSSSHEDDNTEDWDEPETTLRELVGEERSPVEESFYESYIIQSRTAVDNLYASNVLSCQKHMKEMGDLARQRKVKLSSLEREQKKLLKKMENLKEKQESHLQKRSKILPNDLKNLRSKSAKVEQAKTAENVNLSDRRRGSLPPLDAMTTETEDQMIKRSDRLSVPGSVLSKSCNDITSLYHKDLPSQGSTLVLPAIKSSRSHENLSETPFVTHTTPKVHKYPHATRGLVSQEYTYHFGSAESRDAKSEWNEKNFKAHISTKVKWVPRN